MLTYETYNHFRELLKRVKLPYYADFYPFLITYGKIRNIQFPFLLRRYAFTINDETKEFFLTFRIIIIDVITSNNSVQLFPLQQKQAFSLNTYPLLKHCVCI